MRWYCEGRGYVANAVYPDMPAVNTFETDNPKGYHLNEGFGRVKRKLHKDGVCGSCESVYECDCKVDEI